MLRVSNPALAGRHKSTRPKDETRLVGSKARRRDISFAAVSSPIYDKVMRPPVTSSDVRAQFHLSAGDT